MNLKISVIICTRNRAKFLLKAIRSVTRQTIDKKHYELIIVDNNSTDNTKSLVNDEISTNHNIRYFFEPTIGLAEARNTGWRNAGGKYVAYLDDDAIATKNWIEKILDAFENTDLNLGAVGGKVEPIWSVPKPAWLSDDILISLSLLDYNERPFLVKNQNWLIGTNIAFRREALKITGGFDDHLGRKNKRLLSNEELLLQMKLNKVGYFCFYHPKIKVQHYIPAERLSRKWFLRRYFWQGISDYIMESQISKMNKARQLNFVVQMAKITIFPLKIAAAQIKAKHPKKRFGEICEISRKFGYACGIILKFRYQ